jgi:predicted  nucleic acid-binding Zn-ribbon protein
MNKELLGIVELQNLDAQIAKLNLSKKEFPAETEKLGNVIAGAGVAISAMDKKNAQLEAEHKNVLDQIAQAREALLKSENRLNSISTNREYDAVHNEIESFKHNIVTGETRTKSFADETARLNTQKEEAVKEYDRVKAEIQPKIDELNSKIASVDADISAVSEKRSALLPSLNRQYLRVYENILRRRKNGKVVSLISLSDRACQVCHKILEAQLINEIRKGNKLNICESCGSLLIWDSPEVDSNPPTDGGIVANG